MPCHHNLEESLHDYMQGAGIDDAAGYLFRPASTPLPTLAPSTRPSITASDAVSGTTLRPRKEAMIRQVAVLDWMRLATPSPARSERKREPALCDGRARSAPHATATRTGRRPRPRRPAKAASKRPAIRVPQCPQAPFASSA